MQEEGTPVHNYVYSSALVEFVRAANAFCAFLEQLKDTEGRTFIVDSVKHLSTVYASIINTGETEPVLESPSEPAVTEQEWSELFQRIAMILGPYNDILRMVDEERCCLGVERTLCRALGSKVATCAAGAAPFVCKGD